jgi:hypothetical protein
MKALLVCCIFLFSVLTKVASQNLHLQKTSYGSGELHAMSISQTLKVSAIIGQPSLINHFQNHGLHLLQGFKTPYLPNLKSVESKKISVYPNPSFGKILIEWKDDFSDQSLKVQLIEISGKVVDERSVKKDRNKLALDFSEVACGIYVLRISDQKNGVTNTKIFIQ